MRCQPWAPSYCHRPAASHRYRGPDRAVATTPQAVASRWPKPKVWRRHVQSCSQIPQPSATPPPWPCAAQGWRWCWWLLRPTPGRGGDTPTWTGWMSTWRPSPSRGPATTWWSARTPGRALPPTLPRSGAFLDTAEQQSGHRSDTLMVVRVDPSKRRCRYFRFPRSVGADRRRGSPHQRRVQRWPTRR